MKEFPLSVETITEWTLEVVRLFPKEATPEIIQQVMDKFMTGEWEFDNHRGITNIILGIKELTGETPSNWVAP